MPAKMEINKVYSFTWPMQIVRLAEGGKRIIPAKSSTFTVTNVGCSHFDIKWHSNDARCRISKDSAIHLKSMEV